MKKKVKAQAIIDEALSWVGTDFGHQQAMKGVMVDCANFLREVSVATGATPDADFERNYRKRADGSQMLLELLHYLEPVEHLNERGEITLEYARAADVIALHDGQNKKKPSHLAFISRLDPYPKMIHASERGVRHHRIDLRFKGKIHSIWRVPNLTY